MSESCIHHWDIPMNPQPNGIYNATCRKCGATRGFSHDTSSYNFNNCTIPLENTERVKKAQKGVINNKKHHADRLRFELRKQEIIEAWLNRGDKSIRILAAELRVNAITMVKYLVQWGKYSQKKYHTK